MKSKFLPLDQAAAEYIAGDMQALKELLVLNCNTFRLYREVPNRKIRRSPGGYNKSTPSNDEFATWEEGQIWGWYPLPSTQAISVLLRGSCETGCVEIEGDADGFRFGWFTRANGPGPYTETLQLAQTFVSRAALEKQLTAGNSGPTHSPRWPWGGHETEMLRHLAAAAEKWWKNYDPSDPSTAPTNDSVAEWLKSERKVADRNAQVMATILRADGLPSGPRR